MNTDTTILDKPIPGPIEESSCATVDTGALPKWLLKKSNRRLSFIVFLTQENKLLFSVSIYSIQIEVCLFSFLQKKGSCRFP
jgi:hypothetical protein